MKKKWTLLAAAVAALSLQSPVSAAIEVEANPFDDVPRSHWAYEEIAELADRGVIEGYEDGSFRGGQTMTRYEVAALVGRAISQANHANDGMTQADLASLEKLYNEFSHELDTMGVRLAKLEKYQSNAGLFGDVRVRYRANLKERRHTGVYDPANTSDTYAQVFSHGDTTSQFDQRVRLGYWSEISPHFYFTGRMRAENIIGKDADCSAFDSTKTDSTGYVTFDLAEGKWVNDKLDLRFGRLNPTIGLGGIWSSEGEGAMDGVDVTYNPSKATSLSVGYATVSPSLRNREMDDAADGEVYTPSFFASAETKVGATKFTAGMLKTLSSGSHSKIRSLKGVDAPWSEFSNDVYYDMEQYSLGVETQLSPRLKLYGEYIVNEADHNLPAVSGDNLANGYGAYDANGWVKGGLSKDWSKAHSDNQKHGWYAGLSYGNLDAKKAHSYQADLVYMALGNWSIDSSFLPHNLMISGGNGLGLDGARGWGLGLTYMLAPLVELHADYYWMKPYDKGASGFDKYDSPWQVALNYSF